MKTFISLRTALVLLLFLFSLGTYATTTTAFTGAAADQNWGNAANWSNGVPISGSFVTINSSQTVNVLANTVSIATLTLNAGSVLNLGSQDFTVTTTSSLQGTLGDAVAGGINTFIGAATITGNLTFDGNLPILFNGLFTINSGATVTNNNLQVMPAQALGAANGISVPAGGSPFVPAPYANDGGIVLLAGMAGNGAWTQSSNASLSYNTRNVGGAIVLPGTITFSATATGNTVRYFLTTAGGISVPDYNYFNLATCGSNNTCDFTISVNRTITGTWTHDGGRMDVRTLSTSLADRVLTINNLTVRAINNAQRLFRVAINTRNCTVNIQGVLTRAANTSTSTGQSISGQDGNNRLIMLSGSKFIVDGNNGVISNTNIVWSAGSTVEYKGATTSLPQNLAQTFSNFVWNCPIQTASLNMSTVTNINAALRVYGTGSGSVILGAASNKTYALTSLEVKGGTVNLSGGAGVVDVTLTDSLKATGGTIDNGTTASNISFIGTAGNQVLLGGSTLSGSLGFILNKASGSPNTLTANSSFTFPSNLTLTAGLLTADATARTLTVNGALSGAATLDLSTGSHILDLKGATSTWSGTLTSGSNSTVSYTGAADGQNVRSTNYANLTFNSQSKNLLTGTIGISGTFTPSSPTVAHVVNSGNTVSFTGGAQTIPVLDATDSYFGLTTSGSAKSLAGSVLVRGALTTNALITLGSNSLTLADAATIGGSSYVSTNSSGQLIKLGSASADFDRTYRIGTNSGFTPLTISGTSATISGGSLSIRSVGSKQANAGTNAANRYWVISTSGITSPSANLSFTYLDPTDVGGGSQSNYELQRWDGSAWQTPPSRNANGSNPATTTGSTALAGDWTVGEGAAFISITTYTSVGTGNWFSSSTWSPSGVPTSSDNAIISSGHTVTLSSNNAEAKNVTLTGILNASTTTGHGFDALTGTGTLITGTTNIPTIADKSGFISTLGGTLRLDFGTNYPTGWFTVNNLTIGNGSAVSVTTGGTPITVAGNLMVSTSATFTAITIGLGGSLTNNGSLSNTDLSLTGISKSISGGTFTLTNVSNAGSYVLNATSLTIAGTLDGTGTFSTQANANVTISGTVVDGLSFTSAGSPSTVSYTGGSGQHIIPGAYLNLTFNNQNKVLGNGETYNLTGVFTTGSATGHTVTNSTVSFNSSSQTIPAFQYHHLNTVNGNRVLANSGVIKVAGNFTTDNLNYTTTGSTVEYNGSVSQTIANLNYNNLTISSTGSSVFWALLSNRTLTGNVVVSGTANLQLSGSFTLTTASTPSTVTISGGAITINSGTILTASGAISVSGTSQLANNGTLNFSAGGSYIHNRNGGAIPSANWNATSTFEISGTTSTAPTNLNQNLGLVVINSPALTIDFGFNSGVVSMTGLTITHTNGKLFTMSSGGAMVATINGNVTIGVNGIFAGFSLNSGSTNNANISGSLTINGIMDLSARVGNTTNLNVSGNVNVTATGSLISTNGGVSKVAMSGTNNATLSITGAHNSGVIEFAKTSPATVNINSGVTLQNVRFVSGSYTLASNPTINIKGNVTITGNVTSSGAGTVIFNGTTAQTVSGGFAVGFNNLTINNGTGVSIVGLIAEVIGNFTNTAGLSYLSGQLFMTGTGAKTISSASTLALAGFKIDATGFGIVTLNTNITVGRDFETSSRLVPNGHTITLNGAVAQAIMGSSTLFDLTNANTAVAVTIDALSILRITRNLTLNASSNTTNSGTVILASTTTSTARLQPVGSNASWTGNMTIERKAPTLKAWYMLANPTIGAALNNWESTIYYGFAGAQTGNPSTYFHDEAAPTNSGWTVPTNVTNSVPNGRGVRIYLGQSFTGTRTLTTTGAPVIGNGGDGTNTGGAEAFNFAPTFTPAGFDGGGWNFLGNPYASEIDWDAASGWSNRAAGNIDATVYIWNAANSNYMTYNFNTNLGSPNTFNGVIPSGQAFFVKANAGSPSLTATEAVKSTGTPNLYRQGASISPIRLSLQTNCQEIDEAILGFDANSTLGFDPSFDAQKLVGGQSNLAIKLANGTKLSTNILPYQATTLDLVINITNTSTYQLMPLGLADQLAGVTVGLLDRNTGQITMLQDGQAITLSGLAVGSHTNFALVIGGQVTSLGLANQLIAVTAYPNPVTKGEGMQLSFNNLTIGQLMVDVLDAAGRVVYTTSQSAMTSSLGLTLPNSLASGVYSVRYQNGQQVGSLKLVIL